MTARFYLLLALLSVLVMGWIALHYQFEKAQKDQLDDLVSYPIYAYVADTSKVSPLLSELGRFPELDSLRYETGTQAGKELVSTYSLPVGDEMLSGFKFPDIITLRFRSTPAARFARNSVLSTLRQYLPEEDIDLQSIAWSNSEAKLKSLGLLVIAADVLVGLLILLCLIFGRISFEQRLLLLQKRKSVSVVDYLRHKSLSTRHTLMLLFMPLVLGFGLYYLLIFRAILDPLIPYWFMGAVGGTLLVGSLIVMTLLYLMDHDNRLHEGEVAVISKKPEPTVVQITPPDQDPLNTRSEANLQPDRDQDES